MIAGLQAGKFDVAHGRISVTPDKRKKSSLSRRRMHRRPPLRLGRSESRRTREAARRRPDRQLTGDAAHDKTTVDALRVALKGKTIGIQSGTVYTSSSIRTQGRRNYPRIQDPRRSMTSIW